MTRRVVVTGIGVISPLGTKEQLWNSLLDGVSGVGRITHFDASDYPVQIAAEVKDFDATEYMEPKAARRMDLFCQYAVAAAVQSLADAELEITGNTSRFNRIWNRWTEHDRKSAACLKERVSTRLVLLVC